MFVAVTTPVQIVLAISMATLALTRAKFAAGTTPAAPMHVGCPMATILAASMDVACPMATTQLVRIVLGFQMET